MQLLLKKFIINSLFTMQIKHHNYVHFIILEPAVICEVACYSTTRDGKCDITLFEEQ